METFKYVISKRKQHAKVVGDEFTVGTATHEDLFPLVYANLDGATFAAHDEERAALYRQDFGHYFISDADWTYYIIVTTP